MVKGWDGIKGGSRFESQCGPKKERKIIYLTKKIDRT